MQLSDEQLGRFAERGYVVVPSVLDEAQLAPLDAEVDRALAASPPSPETTGKHFVTLPPAALPACRSALFDSPAIALAEQLTHPRRLELTLGHIQIACNIPPAPQRPGGPHIDGQVRQHTEQRRPDTFTMLAGVFLGDERSVDRGNLWVWPRSHLVHAEMFRQRGPHALMDNGGHIGMLDDPPVLGEPMPVFGQRGDLLLAHYLLGHNSGSNLGPDTRRMVYFRLGTVGHGERWVESVTDPFAEFPVLRGG